MDKLREELGKLRDKVAWELIEYYKDNNISQDVEREIYQYTDQAHSAILKLFKQEMLRLIGTDIMTDYKKHSYQHCKGCENDGYNQAKAELRKKVGVDG
jgi:hypothetical protein